MLEVENLMWPIALLPVRHNQPVQITTKRSFCRARLFCATLSLLEWLVHSVLSFIQHSNPSQAISGSDDNSHPPWNACIYNELWWKLKIEDNEGLCICAFCCVCEYEPYVLHENSMVHNKFIVVASPLTTWYEHCEHLHEIRLFITFGH